MQLVAPGSPRRGDGASPLRITVALVCASVLLGYAVVQGPGGGKAAGSAGAGGSATALAQLAPSSAPKLRSVDAIRKLAEQQGKALAEAREAKYAKEKKEEAEDSPLPLDEQRTRDRAHVVHISAEPANEKILRNAEKEAEAQEEANAQAAERLIVTSHDEKKLMGEERKVVASRDAKWRQRIAREAKDETESFSADQKSILSHHSSAGGKGTAKGVESHLKKQIDVITSGEGKSNARIAAVAQAAEAREERHLEEQVASITGAAPRHSAAVAAHPVAPRSHKGHGGHAISKADAEAAVRKIEAEGHGAAAHAPVAAAPRPEHAGHGGHAISKSDAEAAVRRLEAEHAGESPSLHDSPEAKAARAAREKRLEKEVGERAKRQAAYDARAAAAHSGAAPRAESHGSGGHAISMAAAEAAVKKLQGEGAGAAHTAAPPQRHSAVEERSASEQPSSGGHHISMAAAEAAVKKLQAEGK